MIASTTLFSLSALAVLPQALATVFMTSPTAQTTCSGGSTCQIAWMEDQQNTPPLLANWGTASVGLWVGNAQQQTELQRIQDGVDVASTAAITFTPDPSVGPDANIYFIRFTSQSVPDPSNPNAPAESFSAKFTLSGMQGQFNATVQAQISGVTSAGGASSTPASAPASSPPASSPASSSKPASSSGSSKPSGSTTATGAKSSGSSAAMGLSVGSMGAVAPVAALLAFFL